MNLKITYPGQKHNGVRQEFQVELPTIENSDRNMIKNELRHLYANMLGVTSLLLTCSFSDEADPPEYKLN